MSSTGTWWSTIDAPKWDGVFLWIEQVAPELYVDRFGIDGWVTRIGVMAGKGWPLWAGAAPTSRKSTSIQDDVTDRNYLSSHTIKLEWEVLLKAEDRGFRGHFISVNFFSQAQLERCTEIFFSSFIQEMSSRPCLQANGIVRVQYP